MKLSIILPVYNEAATVAEVIDRVVEVNLDKEIIAVDDCSTDGTAGILREKEKEITELRAILLEENQGKGAAIRAALNYVTGDAVVIQDGDLEYDPKDFPRMLQPVEDGEADIVYGSRFRGTITGMLLPNLVANKILSWAASILFLRWITDEATCYKLFRTEVLKSINLTCDRFDFCPEVTARFLKRRYRYKEVPISYHGRSHLQGKKIGWKDGLAAMRTLIKFRFVG